MQNAYGVLSLSLWERRIEGSVRYRRGFVETMRFYDALGTPIEHPKRKKNWSTGLAYNGKIDITDDAVDPRKGIRVEGAKWFGHTEDPLSSTFDTTAIGATLYIPIGGRFSTLAMNYFVSESVDKSINTATEEQLREKYGLECDQIADSEKSATCTKIEDRYIADKQRYNQYGNAQKLGGSQRLRSYSSQRFIGKHSQTYGLEYRMNLTDERTPFDLFIMKGVRTGIQIATFADVGTVSETEISPTYSDDLYRKSYGAGIRIIASSVVLRLDVAKGDEGTEATVILGYPWSLFSIDQ